MAQPQDTSAASPGCVPSATQDFAAALIRWQASSGRHRLPWQNTRDPYRVWLSEIMLQQTQVSAVIPYYARFLEAFPTVEALAAASQEQVMQLWSGLGYYSRARNLHACAKMVIEQHGGAFPSTARALLQLPGIGRSTASAIAAFSFGEQAAILDGNVKRVLCRVFAIDEAPGAKLERSLWSLAESLLPEHGIESYTQGLMDLGATVCTPTNPSCLLCPMAAFCKARITARIAELPRRRVRVATPTRTLVMVLMRSGDDVYVEARPDSGIWGGLWSLPEFESGTDDAQLLTFARGFGRGARIVGHTELHHAFTHYRLHAQVIEIALQQRRDADHAAVLEGTTRGRWLRRKEVEGAALPAPVKKILLVVPTDR